jgi:hypothetical protein
MGLGPLRWAIGSGTTAGISEPQLSVCGEWRPVMTALVWAWLRVRSDYRCRCPPTEVADDLLVMPLNRAGLLLVILVSAAWPMSRAPPGP